MRVRILPREPEVLHVRRDRLHKTFKITDCDLEDVAQPGQARDVKKHRSGKAALIPVETIERFPKDFMFQLAGEEFEILRSQSVTSRSGHGGRRTAPYAFTEQGVAMLSSVLRSSRAVQVNIEIVRAFVRLRQMLQSNAELAKKLETKYDAQFKVVFQQTGPAPSRPAPRARGAGRRRAAA